MKSLQGKGSIASSEYVFPSEPTWCMVMVHVHVESTVKNVKFSHPNEYSDIIKAKKSSSCSIYKGRISFYCQKSIENTWSAASIDETAHQVNSKAQTTVVLNIISHF